MKRFWLFSLLCFLNGVAGVEIRRLESVDVETTPDITAAKSSNNESALLNQFDLPVYEFMIPEGESKKDSVVAIATFFGSPSKRNPQFELFGDDNSWFRLADMEAVPEDERIVYSVPVLVKAGAKVVAGKTEGGMYKFGIKVVGSEQSALLNVEVVDFGPQPTSFTTLSLVAEKSLLTTSSPLSNKTDEEVKASSILISSTPAAAIVTEKNTEEIVTTSKIDVEDAIESLNEAIEESTEFVKITPEVVVTETDSVTDDSTVITSSTVSTDAVTEIVETTISVTQETSIGNVEPLLMPPILLQYVDVMTQLPVAELNVSLGSSGQTIAGYEIRSVLNESAVGELISLSVEPSDIFDVKPRFVLSRMPAHLVLKKTIPELEHTRVKILVSYADIDSPVHAVVDLAVNFYAEMVASVSFEHAEFVFTVPENSATGTQVGEVMAVDKSAKDNSGLIYSLIGTNSDLFMISEGKISLVCPSKKPCLDFEENKEYYFIVIATNLAGVSSDPTVVIIRVLDKNDNPPVLRFPDKTVEVFNGQIVEPFAIKIEDADAEANNTNTVSLEGAAAKFFALDQVGDNSYKLRLTGIPEIGGYIVDIVAADTNDNDTTAATTDRRSLKVEVLNNSGKARFSQFRYERKISAERLHKGNPLIQLQFNGEPVENVQLLFLNGNPGWMSLEDFGGNLFVGDVPRDGIAAQQYTVTVGAIDRQTKRIIDWCEVVVHVESTQVSKSIFIQKVFSTVVANSKVDEGIVMTPVVEGEKRGMSLVDDGIVAWDESMRPVYVPSEAIQVRGNKVFVTGEQLARISGLQFQLVTRDNPNDRALVSVLVTGDAAKYAQRKMRDSQPRFSHPWTSESDVIEVSVPEENSLGHTVLHLPAFNPENGELESSVYLHGDHSEFFAYDSAKGTLTTNKLLDFEALPRQQYNLELVAEHSEYPAKAKLLITVQNLDDNPPQIGLPDGQHLERPLHLRLEENSSPGKTLMQFHIYDADAQAGHRKHDVFSYKLIGEGTDNFALHQSNHSLTLTTSSTVNLDREQEAEHAFLMEVRDAAGNVDTLPVIVDITDKNDNRPNVEWSNKVIEAVENWSVGTVVAQVAATDKDLADNSQVSFELNGLPSKFLEIDNVTGEVKVATALHGLAAADPYHFQVIAVDHGTPPFSSAVDFEIRVLETSAVLNDKESGLRFLTPAVDFVLTVPENFPANSRLLTVEATLGATSEDRDKAVRYSLEPVSSQDEGWLNINPTNGDVFVESGFDFERQNFLTVNIVASTGIDPPTPYRNESRLLRLQVTDIDDNSPVFLYRSQKHALVTFVVDDSTKKAKQLIGKLVAVDPDATPFNDLRYYLLPACDTGGSRFELDQHNGELFLLEGLDNAVKGDIFLCALVNSIPDLKFDSLRQIDFDAANASMIRFAVRQLSSIMAMEMSQIPKIDAANETILTFDSTAKDYKLPVDIETENASSSSAYIYKLDGVDFFPRSNEQPHTADAPDMHMLVNPDTAELVVDPQIVNAPEGIYAVHVQAFHRKNLERADRLVKQVHRLDIANRLKFVFDIGVDELGMRAADFAAHLTEILQSNASTNSVRPVFFAPKIYPGKHHMRSSLCFYLARPHAIVPQEEAVRLTATKMNTNDKLMNMYQLFDVVNIESCSSMEPETAASASSAISKSLVLWVAGGLIAFLLLFSCVAYTCFVTKYRDSLRKKNEKLAGPKLPPPEAFSIPQFIDARHL